jgi:hypothetical protein
MADLVTKLRGDLHPQRFLLAIATEQPVNLAAILMGAYGIVHTGVVTTAHLVQFARHGKVLVQIGIDALLDHRMAQANMPNLFAHSVWTPTTQRKCPTPLFIAIGPPPGDSRTSAKFDRQCLLVAAQSGGISWR